MKKIFIAVFIVAVVRWAGLYSVKYIHETGITNNESKIVEIPQIPQSVIPSEEWEMHQYISSSVQWSQYLPKYYAVGQQYWEVFWTIPYKFINDPCFRFTWNGLKKREAIYDYISEISNNIWINPNFVYASIMWEQLRIGCNTSKQNIKQTIRTVSPTWFISYDFSLGVWWVKPSTAWYIVNTNSYRWYYPYWMDLDTWDMEECLTESSYCQAFFPSAIVNEIIEDRDKYDPGIIWTIYNIWIQRRTPHDNPKVGWSIIMIWGEEVTYWEIVWMLLYQLELNNYTLS